MKVLLVEDSRRLQRSISTSLRKAFFVVDIIGDGAEALWYATHHTYDVMVLDLMLPNLDGLSLIRQLRETPPPHRDIHILVLTAKDTVEDRVAGLRAGADDYMVKPFAIDELVARVEALTRRRHGTKSPIIVIDDLQIDTAARKVIRGGQEVELSAREFALLHFMALHQGEVITRAQIEAHLYDEQVELMSNVVDAAVYSVRKKIDLPGRPSLIRTRRGMGYMLQGSSASSPADDVEDDQAGAQNLDA